MSTTFALQPRMKNPAMVIPEAMAAIQALNAAIKLSDVPQTTLELAHLRASQINGCSFCVHYGAKQLRETGESEERLTAVSAWRETPFFSESERAALALAEAATRLSDRTDPVPDDVWAEAKRHFDERGLSALVLMIAMTNLFNRINAVTRQPAGSWS